MMASSVRCTMSLVLSWVRPISSEIFLTISFLVTLAISTKAWSAHGARRVAQMYLQLGLMSRKNTPPVTLGVDFKRLERGCGRSVIIGPGFVRPAFPPRRKGRANEPRSDDDRSAATPLKPLEIDSKSDRRSVFS